MYRVLQLAAQLGPANLQHLTAQVALQRQHEMLHLVPAQLQSLELSTAAGAGRRYLAWGQGTGRSDRGHREVRPGSHGGQTGVTVRSDRGHREVRSGSQGGQTRVTGRSDQGHREVRPGLQGGQTKVTGRSDRGQAGVGLQSNIRSHRALRSLTHRAWSCGWSTSLGEGGGAEQGRGVCSALSSPCPGSRCGAAHVNRRRNGDQSEPESSERRYCPPAAPPKWNSCDTQAVA